MFSSNQILEVSGEFDQLREALDFAIDYYETQEKDLVFQITEDGKYCIGWKPDDGPTKCWDYHLLNKKYSFISKNIQKAVKL